MIRPLLRSFTALAAAAALLAVVPAASAQTNNRHKLYRLGAVPASAMHVPPLTNAASLKRLMANKKIAADFRKGFEQAGLGSLADNAIGTLTSPMQVTKGGDCSEATGPSLQEGVLVECTVPAGAGIEWMMYRKLIGGKRQVTLFQSVEWAGKKPFQAFGFRIVRKEGKTTRSYQFVLPKACSNLSLLRMTEETEQARAPHALTSTVKSTCDCNNGKLTATVSVTGDTANLRRVRVLVDGNAVGELTAPSWSMSGDRPGTYTFQAEGGTDEQYAFSQSSIRVDACPPPAKVAQTCSIKLTHVEGKKGYDFLIDASGTTSGSPNVPATTVVQLYGPTGAAIGQPITLTGDMKTTVTVPFKKAEGSYRVTSTVSSPNTVADCKQYGGKDNCEATDTVVAVPSTASIFVDGLFGKERRQRPASEYDLSPEQLTALGLTSATAADTLFGQCSPLLGFKVGYAKRFKNDWELAGDAGVAFNLSSGELGNGVDKINPATLLAEVEANKYLNNDAFVGTGLSFWDLTRSETFTPAWLVHFGIPLGHHPTHPVYFIGEGRLFFDNIDSVDNNYNFWGGIRVHFKMR
jgi:hypothetical protein